MFVQNKEIFVTTRQEYQISHYATYYWCYM